MLVLLFSLTQLDAQSQPKYPFFPKDQHCYLGGFTEFYKDFHQILIDKKVAPCENKAEFLTAFVLIRTDGTIQVLENESSKKSKCSFDSTKEVLQYMDKWIPAKIDGQPQATIAKLPIYIDDLYTNYKEGYHLKDFIKESNIDIANFREEVVKYIDMSSFVFKRGKDPLRIALTFSINESGDFTDLKMLKSSGLTELDDMVLRAVKKVGSKNKWIPAKIHDIPINSVFNLPITING